MGVKRRRPAGDADPARHYYVYVVRLDGAILNHRAFRDANPQHNPLKACVYVGMTGVAPEARFAQHKRGYKSARFVERYGVRLLPHLYEQYNPMTYRQAVAQERSLAERLRRLGFGVWQN
jgi:predicted GIY-YIG superfamily endonuclease